MKKLKVKKLTLSTETLRNLNESDLKEAAGGVTRFDCTATYVCSGCAPCA
ncbi:MAG TPA: class I lanthipeptide [Thermoanaerobaculia bacterium]|jgi:hypothetical protein|nr:class I lanthipeptide [Thermoanaerobaculia bacterium]